MWTFYIGFRTTNSQPTKSIRSSFPNRSPPWSPPAAIACESLWTTSLNAFAQSSTSAWFQSKIQSPKSKTRKILCFSSKVPAASSPRSAKASTFSTFSPPSRIKDPAPSTQHTYLHRCPQPTRHDQSYPVDRPRTAKSICPVASAFFRRCSDEPFPLRPINLLESQNPDRTPRPNPCPLHPVPWKKSSGSEFFQNGFEEACKNP